jgi:hypothetical protein
LIQGLKDLRGPEKSQQKAIHAYYPENFRQRRYYPKNASKGSFHTYIT